MSTERRTRYGWRDVAAGLTRRKTGVMLVLGVASGLPFAALAGTLNAWLTEENVSVAAIGVVSFIALAYSFNFMWAPALQGLRAPLGRRLGARRAWMIVLQAITVLAMAGVALSNPSSGLGMTAAAAALGALASASLHIVVDAWRIEVADEDTPIDLLSTIYQLGFRSSTFLAGAGALILAERAGWSATFFAIAGIAAVCLAVSMFAPEPDAKASADNAQSDGVPAAKSRVDAELGGRLRPEWRLALFAPVALGWAWAVYAIISFMVAALTATEPVSARTFTRSTGPLIVFATVVAPALAAVFMLRLQTKPGFCGPAQAGWIASPLGQRAISVNDTLFAAVLAPLGDFIRRLGWSVLIVLAIALTYRLTDQVWGAFAFTFYLGDPAVAAGALQHTNDEIAWASKTFGVLMTITGIAFGGVLLLRVGRMPTLMLGAVLAAATNLLFADLAMDAVYLDAALGALRLDALYAAFGFDQRMARLMTAIALENLSLGIASAAFVAYLSSVVNPRFAAVQYALLASLALLIGTLGRAWLGEMIDTRGFAPVFFLTAALGLFGIAAVLAEWVRLAVSAKAPEAASTGDIRPAQ